MPLDTFCGDAICVDIREYPGGHDVTADEVEKAVAASGQELREGDILLFCSDHYNRTAGTPAFLDGFCGISAEAVHWMADRGVKIFGVETISPDLVYLTDEYPTHRACAERGLTHYENLNNLKEVVDRALPVLRLPAQLEPAYGSPVRAVGIISDSRRRPAGGGQATELDLDVLGLAVEEGPTELRLRPAPLGQDPAHEREARGLPGERIRSRPARATARAERTRTRRASNEASSGRSHSRRQNASEKRSNHCSR